MSMKKDAPGKNTAPRTVYWEPELYRQARIYAASKNMSVNELIRTLVKKALEEEQNGKG